MPKNLNWSCHICAKRMNKQGSGPHLAMHRKRGDFTKIIKSAHLLRKETDGPQISRSKIPSHLSGFAAGHTIAWLEAFAASHHLPLADLEHGVGEILQAEARGKTLGSVD
jgi:hypothetical protein